MIRTLAGLALLFASAVAVAADVGPEIAYVKAGTTSEIFRFDADDSRLRSLDQSGQRMRIFTLDMKPGGGELAFEEVGSSAGTATLKVVRYDDAGTRLSTKSLPVCRILSLDYHPSGSDLLYLDTCSGGRRLNTTTMTSTPLALPTGINKVGWHGPEELIYN